MMQSPPASIASNTEDASPDPESGKLSGASLTEKGSWLLAGLVFYLILATAIIAWERSLLLDAMDELEVVHMQDEQQIELNLAVSHAILKINENYFSRDLETAARLLKLELDGVVAKLNKINKASNDLEGRLLILSRYQSELQREPSKATIAHLRMEFHHLVLVLDGMTTDIRARKRAVLADYRQGFRRMATELIVLMLIGVTFIGGVTSVFFKRLSLDIGLVKARASEIVRGYRGSPLEVTRRDELGVLMASVNEMEVELQSRESELELSRQQHFHTEKMAAVGSLAAAVAHEINNPLSAIVGVAENLVNERLAAGFVSRRADDQQLELILEQARRVMTITRQMGEFALQRPLEPEFVDLNSLIRSTCTFISFDKRFRGVMLEQELASGVPALFVVSDHIVQVLMNVLINAADALGERRGRDPTIRVASQLVGESVILEIEDNGPGIAPGNLERIFEPHFTTKPPGQGSGLGLSLCRNLIQKDGGTIDVRSVPRQGTTVRITLPVPAESEN